MSHAGFGNSRLSNSRPDGPRSVRALHNSLLLESLVSQYAVLRDETAQGELEGGVAPLPSAHVNCAVPAQLAGTLGLAPYLDIVPYDLSGPSGDHVVYTDVVAHASGVETSQSH